MILIILTLIWKLNLSQILLVIKEAWGELHVNGKDPSAGQNSLHSINGANPFHISWRRNFSTDRHGRSTETACSCFSCVSVGPFGRLTTVSWQVFPSFVFPSTGAAVSPAAVHQLLFTVNQSRAHLIFVTFHQIEPHFIYLRSRAVPPDFLHLPNSTTAVAEKVQQLPQPPWFLTFGKHASVR